MDNDVLLSPVKGNHSKCDDDDDSFGECSSESAAMKVQKYYRSYRTRRLLADTAVAAEEFWYHCLVTCLFSDIYLLGLYLYEYLVMSIDLSYSLWGSKIFSNQSTLVELLHIHPAYEQDMYIE